MIWSSANGFQPFAWVPWGVYIGLPHRGTMVIWLDAGPVISLSGRHLIRRLLGPADWWAPPNGSVWSRQAVSAAGGSCRLQITIAVLLMKRARSWGRGKSSAVRRAITVAIPCRVWLMARGAPGRGRPTPGDRLPTGPTGSALAVFRTPTDWWDPSSLGRTGRPSWAQDSALWG